MSKEHPVRVGTEAFQAIKARAAADGVTVKEAADRMVRESAAAPRNAAEDAEDDAEIAAILEVAGEFKMVEGVLPRTPVEALEDDVEVAGILPSVIHWWQAKRGLPSPSAALVDLVFRGGKREISLDKHTKGLRAKTPEVAAVEAAKVAAEKAGVAWTGIAPTTPRARY